MDPHYFAIQSIPHRVADASPARHVVVGCVDGTTSGCFHDLHADTMNSGAGGKCMLRKFIVAGLIQAGLMSMAHAAGPYGNIHVGIWRGGAFTDDNTGAFSHCSAATAYASGITLVVGQNASNGWLLGFASPAFHLTKGNTVPLDVTFDGQAEARLFATA